MSESRRVAPWLFLTALAVCTAVTASTIYLVAPLLGRIADDLGVSTSAAGTIASLAQFGYAAGLLLFVPLGDSVSRRRLVAVLSVVTGLAMCGAGFAPGLPALAVFVLVASATTAVPQLLTPLVSERAPAGKRGRYVAALITGMFTGWVGARVLGGLFGQAFGWRAVYLGAAVLTVVVGLTAAALLPRENRAVAAVKAPRNPFRPLAALPKVFLSSPGLRRACLSQGSLYGVWSALWTTLTLLLTGAPYHLSTGAAGLFGLFGLFGLAASAVAPMAGKLVDRLGAGRVVAVSATVVTGSVLLFWAGGLWLVPLCAAAVLVHAGLVAGHVANQTRALTVTSTPSTANTACVVTVFACGAVGSGLASLAFAHWGWNGACGVAAACAGVRHAAPGPLPADPHVISSLNDGICGRLPNKISKSAERCGPCAGALVLGVPGISTLLSAPKKTTGFGFNPGATLAQSN